MQFYWANKILSTVTFSLSRPMVHSSPLVGILRFLSSARSLSLSPLSSFSDSSPPFSHFSSFPEIKVHSQCALSQVESQISLPLGAL